MRTMLSVVIAAPLLLAATAPWPVVRQVDKKFSTTALTVVAGDTVIFQKGDVVTHNVFSNTAGLAFNLHRQAPGAFNGVRMKTKGTTVVRCAFHPTMKLTLTVR